jgi:glutathione S-transferase
MRARLAISSARRTVELREVVLRDKPDAMIEASPKATVPVLILPDGQVIDESFDVMNWALGDTGANADERALWMQ